MVLALALTRANKKGGTRVGSAEYTKHDCEVQLALKTLQVHNMAALAKVKNKSIEGV